MMQIIGHQTIGIFCNMIGSNPGYTQRSSCKFISTFERVFDSICSLGEQLLYSPERLLQLYDGTKNWLCTAVAMAHTSRSKKE
jgi:hypothetical protein